MSDKEIALKQFFHRPLKADSTFRYFKLKNF